MTESKQPPKSISDVSNPGDSTPSETSRPIIVSNRPMLKDPMMVGGKPKEKPAVDPQIPEEDEEHDKAPTGDKIEVKEVDVQPDTPKEDAKPAEEKPVTTEAPEAEAEKPKDDKDKTETPVTDADGNEITNPDAEIKKAEEAAARDEAMQKMVDSKQFFLPINALEQRRTHRFIVLGIALSIVLALAWLDIALDAGLIHLGGIKAVTHFFTS